MRMLVLELSISFEWAMKREKKWELFTDIWMLELGHGVEVNLNIRLKALQFEYAVDL